MLLAVFYYDGIFGCYIRVEGAEDKKAAGCLSIPFI
jgi:hypothetical protein